MTSTGATQGFFDGVLDEVRIWNVARSQSQIQAARYQQLTSGTGLVARYGLNEGSGTSAASSVAGAPDGTLTNGPSGRPASRCPTASRRPRRAVSPRRPATPSSV